MPVIVEHPQFGVFEFQDGATDQDIDEAFRSEIPNTLRAQRSGPAARRAQLEEDAKREAEDKPFNAADYFGGIALATKGQGIEDLKRQGYSLAEMATRPFDAAMTMTGGEAPGKFFGERAAEAGKRSQEFAELGEALDPSKVGLASRLVASTAVSSSPSIVGSIVGAGLAAKGAATAGAILGGAVTGGAQSAADTFQRAKQAYQEQGDEEGTAAAKAYGPAAIAGVMTGLITRAFGATGIEALANGFKPATIKGLIGGVAKQANLEGGEEALDQLSQGIYERALFNPRKSLSEIVNESLVAYAAGGVLGGGLAGAQGGLGLVEQADENRVENARWRTAIEQSADQIVADRDRTIPRLTPEQKAAIESSRGPVTQQPEVEPFVPTVAPTPEPAAPPVKESLTTQPAPAPVQAPDPTPVRAISAQTQPAPAVVPEPVVPTVQPPPPAATPTQQASVDFHRLLDYENLDALGEGTAFTRDLPKNFPALQRVVLLKARESSEQAALTGKTSKKNTHNFIALLDNDTGTTYLVPAYAQSKKDPGTPKAVTRAMVLEPGTVEGIGRRLRDVLAEQSTTVPTAPRYTPVALAKFKDVRPAYPRAFTADEWQQIERDGDAFRELSRKQIQADARSREKYGPAMLKKADEAEEQEDYSGITERDEARRREVLADMAARADEAQVKSQAADEEAATVATTPPPSGLTSAEVRQMFELAQKAKTVGGFASLNGPFLTTLRGRLNWTGELLWQQLHAAIDSNPTSWEQFYELFDPDGYADFSIDIGRPAQAPRNPNAPVSPSGAVDPGSGAPPPSPTDTLGSLARTPIGVPGGDAGGARPAFYSRLTRTVEQSPQGKASGAQWKALIKNSKLGANADEFGLVGVGDLEDGKVYTKQEVLDYLRANEVVVKDVTLGESDLTRRHNQEETDHVGEDMFDVVDSTGRVRYTGGADDSAAYIADDLKADRIPEPTHFSSYQLPGGKEGSYREVLLTVPESRLSAKAKEVIDRYQTIRDSMHPGMDVDQWNRLHLDLGSAERELFNTVGEEQAYAVIDRVRVGGWHDGHSQYSTIANPIVRLRFNERVTADGKRMLFLEEVQPPQRGEFEKMPALFQKNWREIAFKWALRHAAENGFEAVGWTTGEQQAARYDLSKQVDKVTYDPRGNMLAAFRGGEAVIDEIVPPEKIQDYVGKDIAKKLLEQPLSDGMGIWGDGARSQEHVLSGDGLKVGGEGLKKLYDVDFRNVVNNLPAVKKSGQKVGAEPLNLGDTPFEVQRLDDLGRWERVRGALSEQAARDEAARLAGMYAPVQYKAVPVGGEQVHSLTLTPAIIDSVMGGQALFAPPSARVTPRPAGQPSRPTIHLVTPAEAIEVLTHPDSPIDPTVGAVMLEALRGRGIQKAVQHLGLKVDLVESVNGMLSMAGGYDPHTLTIMLALGTRDPETGAHELAHHLETLLATQDRSQIAQARLQAINRELARQDLPPDIRSFLEAIAAQPRSSQWFDEQFQNLGPRLAEYYSLINASEFFATSFGELAVKRWGHGKEIKGVMARVRRFLEEIRDWFRRTFGLSTVQEQLFHRLISGRFDVNARNGLLFDSNGIAGSLAHVFKNYGDLEGALNPGYHLEPEQVQQLTDLAKTQQALIPQNWAATVYAMPIGNTTPEGIARAKLDPLLEVAFLQQGSPAAIATLPRGTEEEIKRSAEAANGVMQQAGGVQNLEATLQSQADQKTGDLAVEVGKTGAVQAAEAEASFLAGMEKAQTDGYRDYIANTIRTSPAMASASAAVEQTLNRMSIRVDDWAASPGAIKNALRIIARAIPDPVLDAAQTPADIVAWVLANPGVFAGRVGNDIMAWMTTAPIGDPPLAYARVIDDLKNLREIRQDAAGAAQEINDFKAWFAGAGKAMAVNPARFAQSYFKMRTQRDKAARLASGVNRNIDRLDREVRGILMAIDLLKQLQASPEYQASVKLAAEYGNVLVSALMTQDPVTRQNVIIGPSGDPFTVDLRMEAASERQNVQTLNALVAAIDTYLALPPEETDPVSVRSYENIRDYIRDYLLNPVFNPEAGGWTKNIADLPFYIPVYGSTVSVDLFGAIKRRLFSGIAGDAQNVLTRIGGRAGNEVLRNHQFWDFIEKQLSSVSHDPATGVDAVKLEALNAMKSHGLIGITGYATWKRKIENPLIASRQTVGGRWLNVGDVIPTSGYEVTQADMDAVKLEKKQQDGNIRVAGKVASGHPMKVTNPLRIEDTLGTKTVTREAFGSGPLTMMRIPNMDWASEFIRAWDAATIPAERMALLNNPDNFEQAALGHVAQDSSEFKQAGPHKDAYNRVTNDIIKKRAAWPSSTNELIERVAVELVAAGKHPDQITAQLAARDQLLADITANNKRFKEAIIAESKTTSLDSVPNSLVSVVSSQNSFTKARKRLVAPSTYYDYSASSDQRMGQIRNSIRSIHHLRLLEGWNVLIDVIERKVKEYDDQAAASSTRAVRQSSRQKFLAGETRMDYEEAKDFLRDARRVKQALERYTKENPDLVESGLAKGASELLSSMTSQLLSGVGSIVTNTGVGPAFAAGLMSVRLGALSGRWLPGFRTAAGSAKETARNAIGLLTSTAERIPWMKSALQSNLPGWSAVANTLSEMMDDYRRHAEVAMQHGTIAPPNIGQKLTLRQQLPNTGGTLQEERPASSSAEAIDRALSAPVLRHLSEFFRQTFPATGDRIANVSLTETLTKDVLAPLRTTAFLVWQAREQSGNPNWRNLDLPSEALTPQELNVKNQAQARAMRDLFAPVGSLDRLMLDYYERAKAVPVDQRHTVPFMTEGQEAAVTLEYLKATNLPTDSNRAYLFRGRGGSGLVRRFGFMFMGYINQLAEQLSLLSTRHSKDVGSREAARQVAMMMGVLILAIIVGSLGREASQPLARLLTGESSSRPTLANVVGTGDALSYGEYAATSMVSMIPYMGEFAARMFGGSANRPLFDPTAMIPGVNFINSGFTALTRIGQTGDPYYPMIDFARQWSPGLRIGFNALGLAESDRAGRNALRALSAAAPSSIEQRRPGGSRGAGTQTPMTPIVRDLVAAAYAGDEAQVAAKYQQAVEEKRRQGTPDPEQAVLSQLQSQVPARRAFGRLPSEGELQITMGRMSTPQRADYDRAVGAFDMISRVAGKEIPMVQPAREERPTFSGATRTRRSRSGFGRVGGFSRRTRRSTFGRSTRRLSGFGRRRKKRRQSVLR